MGYFEIRVTVDRPLATVFATYTDIQQWKASPHILDAEWVQGQPWEEGSRMRLKFDAGAGGTADQVLTHFEPNREVAYLSHFTGITMETRLNFRSLSEQSTEIFGRIEFVGVLSRVVGFAVGPALERGTRQFFEDMKRQIELVNPAEEHSGVSPENLANHVGETNTEIGEFND